MEQNRKKLLPERHRFLRESGNRGRCENEKPEMPKKEISPSETEI